MLQPLSAHFSNPKNASDSEDSDIEDEEKARPLAELSYCEMMLPTGQPHSTIPSFLCSSIVPEAPAFQIYIAIQHTTEVY